MWRGEGDADAIIEARGLRQISDSGELESLIDGVIAENETQVEQYLAGKNKVLGFFVGQIMKRSGGKATHRKSTNCSRPSWRRDAGKGLSRIDEHVDLSVLRSRGKPVTGSLSTRKPLQWAIAEA